MMQPLDKSFSYQTPYAKHNRLYSETTFNRIFTQTEPSIPQPSNANYKKYKPQRFANTNTKDSISSILNYSYTEPSTPNDITSKPNSLPYRYLTSHTKQNTTHHRHIPHSSNPLY